ncbi:MAG TPA: NAD(P)-dependent alcohol dehydrogenase [Candidatus Limnocylindrales bacterium]|nr:NAD(P)-dependent alcohol dehydrogenase [Candidatus Limnocylindrales bacterium]
MKAAIRTRYGPPEVVRIAEVPTPPIDKDDLVRVRVHATTVNRTDCGMRAAKPFFIRLLLGLSRPRQAVIGSEFAGVVDAVGSAVTAFKPGDRVFGFDEGQRGGAHAEYLVMPADAWLVPMPETLSFEQAAACTEGSHYAQSCLRAARVRAGQDVLVNGATGAIGSAAVQLLKVLGANVTAVCRPDALDLVRRLGADRVIDYTTTDFTDDKQTYDVVFDAVGKSTFGRCRRLLKPRGVYLSTDLGPWSQNLVLPLATGMLRGRRSMFPFPRDGRGNLLRVKGLLEAGRFRPVVDRVYPLDDIVAAYRYVESGQKIGSVVINVVSNAP